MTTDDPSSTPDGSSEDAHGAHSPGLGRLRPARTTGDEPELSGLRATIQPLIVCVDDQRDVLQWLGTILEIGGYYKVVQFLDGEQALEFCRRTLPDALITDLLRPRMNGAQLCEAIRADSRLRQIPIIVHSAGSLSDTERERLDVLFIPKQIGSIDALLRAIDEHLRAHGVTPPIRPRRGGHQGPAR